MLIFTNPDGTVRECSEGGHCSGVVVVPKAPMSFRLFKCRKCGDEVRQPWSVHTSRLQERPLPEPSDGSDADLPLINRGFTVPE